MVFTLLSITSTSQSIKTCRLGYDFLTQQAVVERGFCGSVVHFGMLGWKSATQPTCLVFILLSMMSTSQAKKTCRLGYGFLTQQAVVERCFGGLDVHFGMLGWKSVTQPTCSFKHLYADSNLGVVI